MNKTKILYFILIASIVLLVKDVSEIGMNELKTKAAFRPITDIIAIIAIIISLTYKGKK